MAEPIYKVFRAKWREPWYQLSQEERDSRIAKISEPLDTVGGKRLVFCESYWASEEWGAFGVEVFPDIEAVQTHAKLLNELDWFRYVESSSMLGTEYRPTE